MSTGEKIKCARISKGLTQKQLGELCGIAEPNIRKYETDRLNPKLETLQKIANALEVSVIVFIEEAKVNRVHNLLNNPNDLPADDNNRYTALKEFISVAQMSNRAFAKECGIKPTTFQAMLDRKSGIKPETLITIDNSMKKMVASFPYGETKEKLKRLSDCFAKENEVVKFRNKKEESTAQRLIDAARMIKQHCTVSDCTQCVFGTTTRQGCMLFMDEEATTPAMWGIQGDCEC